MLAVVELGGNQFIVRVGDVIDVKKMDAEVNSTVMIHWVALLNGATFLNACRKNYLALSLPMTVSVLDNLALALSYPLLILYPKRQISISLL